MIRAVSDMTQYLVNGASKINCGLEPIPVRTTQTRCRALEVAFLEYVLDKCCSCSIILLQPLVEPTVLLSHIKLISNKSQCLFYRKFTLYRVCCNKCAASNALPRMPWNPETQYHNRPQLSLTHVWILQRSQQGTIFDSSFIAHKSGCAKAGFATHRRR